MRAFCPARLLVVCILCALCPPSLHQPREHERSTPAPPSPPGASRYRNIPPDPRYSADSERGWDHRGVSREHPPDQHRSRARLPSPQLRSHFRGENLGKDVAQDGSSAHVDDEQPPLRGPLRRRPRSM